MEGRLDREEIIALGPRELAEDYLLFGLRLNEGIDLKKVSRLCPNLKVEPLRLFLDQLVEAGLAERKGSRFWVTDQGRLLVDRIGSEAVDRFIPVA